MAMYIKYIVVKTPTVLYYNLQAIYIMNFQQLKILVATLNTNNSPYSVVHYLLRAL